MKYLSSVMYVGVFATAYCTFLYQHYSADLAAAVATHETTPEIKMSSIQKAPKNAALVATIQPPAPSQPGTKPSAAANRIAVTTPIHTETHAAPEQKHDNGQTHKIAMIDVSSTRPVQRATQSRSIHWSSGSYSSSNTADTINTSTAASTASTGAADKSRPVSAASNNEPSSASDNSVSSKNIVGGEYLPDGKSQEDLYNSQNPSKGPRSYSIADYRKSSINCNSFLGDGKDAQTSLIHSLKGC